MAAGPLASHSGGVPGEALRALKDKNITLVAFDFDMTIINVHTHGRWSGTAESLLPHVNKWAKQLLTAIFDEATMFAAIVTFSSQPELIRDILKKTFPEHSSQIEMMPIICNNTSFFNNNAGKITHIQSAISEIEQKTDISFKKRNVILLDDDMANIQSAKSYGYLAVHISEEFDLERLISYMDGLRRRDSFTNDSTPQQPEDESATTSNSNTSASNSNTPAFLLYPPFSNN